MSRRSKSFTLKLRATIFKEMQNPNGISIDEMVGILEQLKSGITQSVNDTNKQLHEQRVRNTKAGLN